MSIPFIIYTNRDPTDKCGWVRYIPTEQQLDGGNSDLARMTLEDLELRAEANNRKLCRVMPTLVLAVSKPERQERFEPQVKYIEMKYACRNDKTARHESIAVLPGGDTFMFLVVTCSPGRHAADNNMHGGEWSGHLEMLYKLSQTCITGFKKVKAILDLGENDEHCGHAWEIVLDWEHNPRTEMLQHVRAMGELMI